MTQEQKAKAYDEALERAKSFQENFGGDYAGYIFPELKESEDEKIRRDILAYFNGKKEKDKQPVLDLWIAYLEKQKEQKPAEWSEDDEQILKGILDCYKSMNPDWRNWLKSLRPQNHWKPSDEQIRPLEYAIEYFKKRKNDTTYLESLYNDLKKL